MNQLIYFDCLGSDVKGFKTQLYEFFFSWQQMVDKNEDSSQEIVSPGRRNDSLVEKQKIE